MRVRSQYYTYVAIVGTEPHTYLRTGEADPRGLVVPTERGHVVDRPRLARGVPRREREHGDGVAQLGGRLVVLGGRGQVLLGAVPRGVHGRHVVERREDAALRGRLVQREGAGLERGRRGGVVLSLSRPHDV